MQLKRLFNTTTLREKLIHLYILALPFAPRYFSFYFIKNKLLFSDLVFLFLLPVAGYALWNYRSLLGLFRANRIYILILALLLATAGSMINSVNLKGSLVDWSGLLYLGLLFLIIVETVNSKESFIRLLITYSLSAFIVVLLGESAFVYSFFSKTGVSSSLLYSHPSEASVILFPRIKAFFYTPNMFSSFELVALALISTLFFLLRKEVAKKRILSGIFFTGFVIVLIGAFLAGSQTFAGVILMVFILLFLFQGRFASVLRYAVCVFAVFIMLIAISATVWMIYPVTLSKDKPNKTLSFNINYSWSHHIIPSIYAISMFKKHPFFGVGIGTFRDQFSNYSNKEIEGSSCEKMLIPVGTPIDPHNTYSGAMAEWGGFGLFAILCIFGQLISMLILSLKKGGFLADGPGFSLFAGFVGFIFSAFFIDVMMMRHFWIFMAIIFIFYKLRAKAEV